MKFKILAFACTAMLAFGFSLTAGAGSIADVDNDLIPDVFDNCPTIANGPGDALNQTDGDNDGFGTACDCDFTQDNIVLGDDLLISFGLFNGPPGNPPLEDHSGDNIVLGDDLLLCFAQFNGPPG